MSSNKETKGEEESYLNPILILKHSFHMLSLTLLTLLLPLSFLLLAKLTTTSPSSSVPPPPYAVLRFLASFISVSSLLYSLTGHLPRPRTTIAWAVVFTFQVSISLGIEATIATGIKPPVPTTEISCLMWVERVVFFLGLYDTMLHWMRVFVKPVVDDTVYGMEVREGRVDRVAIGAAFGGLWLWMLRDEVEPLIVAAGKGGLLDCFAGWDGFVLWLVSYTTLVTGMVRVVEVIFWVGCYLFCCLCHRAEADAALLPAHDPRTDEVVLLL